GRRDAPVWSRVCYPADATACDSSLTRPVPPRATNRSPDPAERHSATPCDAALYLELQQPGGRDRGLDAGPCRNDVDVQRLLPVQRVPERCMHRVGGRRALSGSVPARLPAAQHARGAAGAHCTKPRARCAHTDLVENVRRLEGDRGAVAQQAVRALTALAADG